MKISLNWLSDFIDLKDRSIQQVIDRLTESTAEVEMFEEIGQQLHKIVVGKVDKLKLHPNADKLKLALVNDGQEVHQVVCGGANLEEGMIIAYAPPGAKVRWHGEGDVIELKKARIRGEESCGMICASNEIGLGEMFPDEGDYDILDLNSFDLEVGTPLKKALKIDDTMIEIDNHAITHRADLFSQIGFAREFVANDLATFKKESQSSSNIDLSSKEFPLKINFLDPGLCSRYTAVVLKNITIQESPTYIKHRLQVCGIRPINNVVDMTNYIMLEYGTPCHAFDLDKIDGQEVTMRRSKKGEKLITLDGGEHELPTDAIIIEDQSKIFDLGGIMGGASSEISVDTKQIWFHIATFDKVLVRRAALALGHRTDASTIFEKGVSPYFVKEALSKGVNILQEIDPNVEVASKVLDIRHYQEELKTLDLRIARVSKLAGVKISAEEIISILKSLGFEIKEKNNQILTIKIPGWRNNDIQEEVDLIEEVTRIYGYHKIPAYLPIAPVQLAHKDPHKVLINKVKNQLTSIGFTEVYNFSFLGEELIIKTGFEMDETYLKLANYITEDISIMRQSLWPRLLETVTQNLRYRSSMQIFEYGKVLKKNDQNVQEDLRLSAVWVGGKSSFQSIKGASETIFKYLNLQADYRKFTNSSLTYHHPSQVAEIIVHGKSVGVIFALHPLIKENFDFNLPVYCLDIDCSMLMDLKLKMKQYKSLPKYPAVSLDLNVILDRKYLSKDLLNLIKKKKPGLLRDWSIIDEYHGEQIPTGKKSLTLSFTYNSLDCTLTDQEVKEAHGEIINLLEKEGVEQRNF